MPDESARIRALETRVLELEKLLDDLMARLHQKDILYLP